MWNVTAPRDTQAVGSRLMRITKVGLIILAVAVGSSPVLAEFPERPITMVVPFPPGGSSDIIARVVAKQMERELKQPIIIENRGGGATVPGTLQVVKARPDGYTILSNSSSTIFSMSLIKQLPYDTFKDLAPVAVTAAGSHVLLVANSVSAQTLPEFITLLRSSPRKLRFATSGSGNINHIVAERFLRFHGVEAVHVPYKGGNDMYPDLITGRVDFYFSSILSAKPYVDSNQMRPLVVTGEERFTGLTGVPAYPEVGMRELVSSAWQGVMAPAGTPPEVVKKINAGVIASLRNPEVKQELAKQGFAPMPEMTPDQYGSFLKSEFDRWDPVIKAAGIEAQ